MRLQCKLGSRLRRAGELWNCSTCCRTKSGSSLLAFNLGTRQPRKQLQAFEGCMCSIPRSLLQSAAPDQFLIVEIAVIDKQAQALSQDDASSCHSPSG